MSEDVGMGVDPGLRACGVAFLSHEANGWNYCAGMTIQALPRKPGYDFVARLRFIEEQLKNLLQIYAKRIRWIAIEDPLYVIAGKQRRKETNFEAIRVMAVVGLAASWGFRLNVPVVLLEPGDVKRAVGANRASSKERVVRCVRAIVRQCPEALDEHRADACATAIAGARRVQFAAALAQGKQAK
jgi:Holliday junction resolvasome RuvABC endonuclease subunit